MQLTPRDYTNAYTRYFFNWKSIVVLCMMFIVAEVILGFFTRYSVEIAGGVLVAWVTYAYLSFARGSVRVVKTTPGVLEDAVWEIDNDIFTRRSKSSTRSQPLSNIKRVEKSPGWLYVTLKDKRTLAISRKQAGEAFCNELWLKTKATAKWMDLYW